MHISSRMYLSMYMHICAYACVYLYTHIYKYACIYIFMGLIILPYSPNQVYSPTIWFFLVVLRRRSGAGNSRRLALAARKAAMQPFWRRLLLDLSRSRTSSSSSSSSRSRKGLRQKSWTVKHNPVLDPFGRRFACRSEGVVLNGRPLQRKCTLTLRSCIGICGRHLGLEQPRRIFHGRLSTLATRVRGGDILMGLSQYSMIVPTPASGICNSDGFAVESRQGVCSLW